MNKTLNVIDSLRNFTTRTVRGAEIEPIVAIENGHAFSARYVGDWEVPSDEEDDGDYDWMVPTAASVKRLNAIAKEYSTKDVKVSWCNDGEKCWITFTAKETK
jgi:hypothetical protein